MPSVDQREWDDLARADAMWAVLSVPGTRGSWDEAAFFASGEQEIAGLMAGLAEHDLDPPRGRALDFGCGLGRLTRPLSERFEAAVGIDVSPQMVQAAQARHADRPNCSFVVNDRHDLALLDDDSFDLVISFIALQHVASPAVARGYIAELARVCRGVLVFQVPERVAWRIRLHPARLLNRLLRALPRAPDGLLRRLMPWSMRLVAVPEAEVRAALDTAGAEVVTTFADRRTGTDAAPSRVYVSRRGTSRPRRPSPRR